MTILKRLKIINIRTLFICFTYLDTSYIKMGQKKYIEVFLKTLCFIYDIKKNSIFLMLFMCEGCLITYQKK